MAPAVRWGGSGWQPAQVGGLCQALGSSLVPALRPSRSPGTRLSSWTHAVPASEENAGGSHRPQHRAEGGDRGPPGESRVHTHSSRGDPSVHKIVSRRDYVHRPMCFYNHKGLGLPSPVTLLAGSWTETNAFGLLQTILRFTAVCSSLKAGSGPLTRPRGPRRAQPPYAASAASLPPPRRCGPPSWGAHPSCFSSRATVTESADPRAARTDSTVMQKTHPQRAPA